MFVKDIYRYILDNNESRLDQIVTNSKNNWSLIGSLLFAIRHEFVNGNNGLYDSLRKKYHKDCLPPSNKADTFQGHLLEPSPSAAGWTPPPDLANWLKQPLVEPDLLPAGSFGLCSSFILAAPYLSKDDRPFYWTDNPLRRDKTINLPIVPGSAWKGALLRAATGLVLERSSDEEKQAGRAQLYRLFGDESGSQKRYLDSPDMIPCELPDRSRQGRLRFFPTYFNRVALTMLNPHDRKTRAGKNPINIECVPAGSQGRLFILYCPFDLAGLKWNEINTEVEADERLVGAAMKEMLEKTGFGAKTSSGFGKAQEISIYPVFKNFNRQQQSGL